MVKSDFYNNSYLLFFEMQRIVITMKTLWSATTHYILFLKTGFMYENTGFSQFKPILTSCSSDWFFAVFYQFQSGFFFIWPYQATGYGCGCIKIWQITRLYWTLKLYAKWSIFWPIFGQFVLITRCSHSVASINSSQS